MKLICVTTISQIKCEKSVFLSAAPTPILSGIVCPLCPSPLPVPVIQAFIWLIKRITLSAVLDVIKFSIFPLYSLKTGGWGLSGSGLSGGKVGWQVERREWLPGGAELGPAG